MSLPELSRVQARVIACLVEKSITTPAYYPMTVNALINAANQKSARSPVMSLRESDVAGALTDLAEFHMAERDDTSSRAPKWRHRFGSELLLPKPVMAVLVTLMLRGPQTAAELRGNAAVLHGPEDAEGVRAALERLSDRADPLVRELPRAPGQAATRWAHLLCGEPEVPAVAAAPARTAAVDNDALVTLKQRVDQLEADMAAMRAALGMSEGEAS